MSKTISVSDFINTKYREYWNYSNSNGKNAIDPREQMPEVVRKIIYASYRLKIREKDEHKTTELMGEVGKFHAHGPSSIEDSIKGVATGYKSQNAVRLLEGIGNFGSAPGDEGAAGRYTSIAGSPLMTAIYKDIPFVPFNTDDTGLEQPEYISVPLPLSLINGASAIGTGKSCYLAEREAVEIINWIDKLRKSDFKKKFQAPHPMSVTGCKTWYNEDNGYIYYEALVHKNVDVDDLSKRGRYDIVTALPPKSTAANVIYKITKKLAADKVRQNVIKGVLDGSGFGRNTYIIVPRGYLKEEDYTKYGMRTARKEQIFVWDHDENTMRNADIHYIAEHWFKDRCAVVTRRIQKQIADIDASIHRIDLIKIFAENKMIDWKSEDVIKFFKKINADTGEDDANLVLSQPARTFLPENLGKNEILREKNLETKQELENDIANIGDVVINEAYSIIEKQQKFFDEANS